ncbi:MAG: TetR/AcrR family transcriptional regulator C-terminal domain-containing protein [Nocardioides sp.]
MTPRASTATRPGRGGAKSELSRAAIVERALKVMDVDGPDAVTIRRLAQEFEVTPMALYWHVANKDELLEAMGDAMLDGIAPLATTGPWSGQLRGVALALVEAMRTHPAAAELVLPRILVHPDGLALTEFTLAMLQDAGFSVAQSADLARTGLQTAIMLVTQLPGAETQAAEAQRDMLLQQKRDYIAALPADRFPHVREASFALTDCADVDAYYGFGIDVFVAGAEALLRKVKRAR